MSPILVAIKNLRRQILRNLLTVSGVAATVFTLLLLITVLSMWAMGEEFSAPDRIATRHKVTFVMTLPQRYLGEVETVDGVAAAAGMSWFGGKLAGRGGESFASIATDPKRFFDVYREVEVEPAQKQAWFEDKRGALIGEVLAQKFGWQVGDEVSLSGTIYPGVWRFKVAGIYRASKRSTDLSTLYFHWDYFNDNVRESARDRVGWIVSRAAPGVQVPELSRRIDAHFDASEVATASMSQHALSASFFGALNTLLMVLRALAAGVFLIMTLILANNVAMGVRERTREYGVMRAIGFGPRSVLVAVVGESVVLGFVGAALGVGLAVTFVNGGVGPVIERQFATWFPYFRVRSFDALLTGGLTVAGAMVAGALPGLKASRIEVTDALRVTG